MNYRYTLTKLSTPGFTLETDNQEYVDTILNLFICKNCKEHYGTSLFQKLDSNCGAEFCFEVEDD